PAAPAICFLAKAQRFHLRPLGVCQYEAIHTDFESHLVTLKKYNSQQTLKKASPKTSLPKTGISDLPQGEGLITVASFTASWL
ncbi:hypothetical protein, partial [Komagataeibacter sp. FXV3]|uniref:hypothetical protein n=1 Tax=Komagataeibacter sp. FXV3 TaxID=2608998 RepID=UPI001D10B121